MSSVKNGPKFKLATANVILIANAFVWYLLAFNTLKSLLGLEPTTPQSLLVFGINTGAIAIAGLIGSLLIDKIKNRVRFLYLWIASGIILSLIPLALNVSDINQLCIVSLVFGLYFGFGMPATMGYHSSLMNIEGRAKVGGFAFLIIGGTFAFAGLLIFNSLIVTCLVLALVRLLGLAVFHFFRAKEEPNKETVKMTYRQILSNKSFLLYFAPWCMFTLVNYMTIPLQLQIFGTQQNYETLTSWENAVIAIVAVVSGFIADKLGRKRLIIIGFIMLGIGYAFVGLFAINSADKLLGSLIYIISDGIAWGIFYVLFVFTLWGDLAQNRSSDKLYFLGALPYVSSYFMQLLFAPYIANNIDSTTYPTTIFSFASVFLFLAVLPLIYAPETLPEKNMKERELKTYIKKAQQIAQKEENKKKDKSKSGQEPDEDMPEQENSEEYKKAKELAEKYY